MNFFNIQKGRHEPVYIRDCINAVANETTGALSGSAYPMVMQRLLMPALRVRKGTVIKFPYPYLGYANFYETLTREGFIESTYKNSQTGWKSEIRINRDCYAIIVMQKQGSPFYMTILDPEEDNKKIIIEGDYEVITHKVKPSTLPALWRYNRLQKMGTVKIFTPQGVTYPLVGNDDAFINQPLYGVPYSAQTRIEGYVCCDVSMYTYLSACANPKSVIYTDKFDDYGSDAYYGTDCSGLVWSAIGLHDIITTYIMWDYDRLEEVTDLSDVKPLDILLKTGHAGIVADVIKDKYGRVVAVSTFDAQMSYMGHGFYLFEDFAANVGPGANWLKLFRYKDINAEVWPPVAGNYPFFGEPADTYDFPDIMPAKGDKVTVKAGTDVLVTVVDAKNYTSVQVYKDGTLIDTKSVADFTISGVSVGDYEIRPIPGGKSSFFKVANVTLSQNGNNVTFTTDGATAYTVSAYDAEQTDGSGNFTAFTDKKKIHFLTAEEIAAGTADVQELVEYARAHNGYLKIKAYNDYGTVWARCEVV